MYATAMEPHSATLPAQDIDAPPVIPLPRVLDTPAVVLVGLLMGHGCDVVLDASAVRVVRRSAGDALATMLARAARAGGRTRIRGAAPSVRRRLDGHPLAAYLTAAARIAADEAALTCPFLDDIGFRPSLR